jgi:cell division septation protein DedD
MTNGLPQRKRFYFYRDQLVVLGCAFTLASVIIFVLGGLTGKTIAHRRMAERAASVVKIPVNLPSTELNLPPGAQAGDGAAAEKSSTKDAAAERGDDMRADKPQPQGPTATNDAAGLPAPVKEPTVRPPDATAAKIPQKNTPAPALREESKLSQPAKTESAYPMWTVQVRSSSDKKLAESWVDRLRSKGYDAFIVEGDVQGQTWYRVRVGLLAAKEEAEALQSILATKEALSETFVLQAVK